MRELTQRAVEHLSDAAYWMGEDRRFFYVNGAACRSLGYTREELLQLTVADVDPEWPAESWTTHWQMLRQEGHRVFESRHRRKDGSCFPVEISASHVILRGREYCCAFARDISERIAAGKALRDSEAMFRGLAEQTPNMVFILAGRRIGYANAACRRLLGFSAEEFADPHFDLRAVVAPDCLPRLEAHLRRQRTGVELPPRDFALLTKEGARMEVLFATRLITYQGGEAILGVVTDITARRRSEATTRRLATAIEQSAEAVMITDAEGRIEYVNPAFAAITGYDANEVRGRTPGFLSGDREGGADHARIWQTIRGGVPWAGHLINRRKDGTLYEEENTVSPIRDGAGAITHYVSVSRDVTRERQLEQQLHQAQKMEAIGQLAGGVAHDFHNILAAIMGYANLLHEDLQDNGDLLEFVESIEQATERAAAITRQLLTFARQGSHRPRPVDVNGVIREALKLLGRTVDRRVEIETSLCEEPALVLADPTQLEQVVINLGINARDALPDGGRVVFATRHIEVAPGARGGGRDGPRPGRYVEITVSDTGTGIAPELLSEIYNPFFSTKEIGKGTGLGLATTYGIVKRHNGFIELDSQVGEGTTFRLTFQACEPEAEAAPFPGIPTGPAPFEGNGHILLVDDDPAVADSGRRLLRRFGYRVTVCSTPREAVAVYRDRWRDIDLVVLDLNLPEMSGLDCLRAMREVNLSLRCIIATGVGDASVLEQIRGESVNGLLQKPFTMSALGQALAAAIG